MFEQIGQIVNILPFDVKNRLNHGEKLQIIDVREPSEVRSGKIPGARNIRLSEIPDRLAEIDKSKEAIIVCRSGGRSANACAFLLSQGFTKVKNLLGGMNAWDGEVK